MEQNYELPEEVLKEMDVETIHINRAKAGMASAAHAQPTANINRLLYETIDVIVLRHGVIGVNKIGYIL